MKTDRDLFPHTKYFPMVFALFLAVLCAGCGKNPALLGSPPGNYVDVCTNFNGQEIASIETNTWQFSPDGKFVWPEQPVMPFKGTYRVDGNRVLLTFENANGSLVKDHWYFDITTTGLEAHDRATANKCEHLVKLR